MYLNNFGALVAREPDSQLLEAEAHRLLFHWWLQTASSIHLKGQTFLAVASRLAMAGCGLHACAMMRSMQRAWLEKKVFWTFGRSFLEGIIKVTGEVYRM